MAANLVAAATAPRKVLVKVAVGADTGIYLNAAGPATAAHFLLGPGEVKVYETAQAISAIRAGASNVTVFVEVQT